LAAAGNHPSRLVADRVILTVQGANNALVVEETQLATDLLKLAL
jgi:hypothetical protein